MAYQINTLLNQRIKNSLSLLIDVCGGVHAQLKLIDLNKHWVYSTICDSNDYCKNLDMVNQDIVTRTNHIEISNLTNHNLMINNQPIKHYIGIDLITDDGDILGNLCLIDIVEKELPSQQLSLFNALSQNLTTQLLLDIKEHQLTLLKEKNQRLNDEFNEFSYFASHDLKSPLNAIKNIAAWIEEDIGNDAPNLDENHFPMMKNNINRMIYLLADLRRYSDIGKNDGEAIKLTLSHIIEACCLDIELTKMFNITVSDIELELPKIPLQLILSNLISNAVKHHPNATGNIHIDGQLNDNVYQLSVTDDGCGIEQQYQDKIFSPFCALKSKDDLEASGLGLAMIKKALLPYSGRIILESEGGNGSTFIVFWPKK